MKGVMNAATEYDDLLTH